MKAPLASRLAQRKASSTRPSSAFKMRDRGDSAFTLTELLIASTLLVVLLTVVMVTMSLFSSISENVTSQYQEYDQALPALAPLQKLIRAEIEPALYAFPNADAYNYSPIPPATASPTAAFASVGNFSLTFYANVGTAYNNVTSVTTTTVASPTTTTTIPTTGANTAGPAKIVAEELDQNGAPVTSATTCQASTPCSFQVRQYLPLVNSDGTPTCPVGTDPGPACQYGSNYTLVTNVLDVVNNPYVSSSNPVAPSEPIFTYSIIDPITDDSITPTTANLEQTPQNPNLSQSFTIPADEISDLGDANLGGTTTNPPNGISYNSVASSASMTACGLPTSSLPTIALSCPADAINSVGINLQVGVHGAGNNPNSQVENETVVYRYPADAGSTYYPYQCAEATDPVQATCQYSLSNG